MNNNRNSQKTSIGHCIASLIFTLVFIAVLITVSIIYHNAKKHKRKLYLGKSVVEPSVYILFIVLLSIVSLIGVLFTVVLAKDLGKN